MKLLNICKIFLCYIYVLSLRLRYGNKCKIKAKQMFGKGIKIKCMGNGQIQIGNRLYTRDNVYILADDGKIIIGNGVFMNRNVSITSKNSIEIGDNVTIANNVVIVDHDHKKPDSVNQDMFITKPVQLGENVWIGANAVILKGVKIGKNSIVAAGSVVIKNVENNTLVAGIPAKIIKKI